MATLKRIYIIQKNIKNVNKQLKYIPFVICCLESSRNIGPTCKNETIPIFPGLSLVHLLNSRPCLQSVEFNGKYWGILLD
jgi:hypothetical protein